MQFKVDFTFIMEDMGVKDNNYIDFYREVFHRIRDKSGS